MASSMACITLSLMLASLGLSPVMAARRHITDDLDDKLQLVEVAPKSTLPTNKNLMQTIEDSSFLEGLPDAVAYKERVVKTLCFVYFQLTDELEAGCDRSDGSDWDPKDLERANSFVLIGQVVQATKGYIPRPNQMLMTYLMTDGLQSGGALKQVTFGQVNTGQGKTLIAAMVALYIKSSAQSTGMRTAIGILTTNGVLTQQNYQETKDIFEMASKMFQLQLDVLVFDPDGSDAAKSADIIYLSPFDLSRDYAHFYRNGEMEPMLPWHLQGNLDDPNFKSAVIVDEVDAILYDGVGETYLSVRMLPYSDKLAAVATKIAQTCSEPRNYSGAELHGLLNLGADQPVQHNKHFVTSACEDPVKLASLKEAIEKEVAQPPSKMTKAAEKAILGKVSDAKLDAAGEQVLAVLNNGRLYSRADVVKFKTLTDMYDWIVDIFETRDGKGKGKAYINSLLSTGRLSELAPLLQLMPAGLGCEIERNDFGLCKQYRAYVKAQLPRWLREARNLLGSQPMLIQDHNYMMRGMGVCKHVLGSAGPLSPPEAEVGSGGSCSGMATSLMCGGEISTDLGGDKRTEVRTRSCANKWLHKLAAREPVQNDPDINGESADLRTRLLKLLGMLSGEAGKEAVKEMRKEVSFSQVIYVEHVSGTIRERTRFNGFKHLFLEYKHNGAVITNPSSETVALSRIRAMEGFNIVLGFTGTLPKEVSEASDPRSVLQQREHSMFVSILKHLYGAGEQRPRLVYVTPFVESRMILKDAISVKNEDEKLVRLGQEIASISDTHCVLVVAQDIGTTHQMSAHLTRSWEHDRAAPVFQFTGDGRDSKVANMKFEAGQVVVTTAVGSRGVDWSCSASGGFEVIATYMSRSSRVQHQIMGRAGRSGQKGSYLEIVSDKEVTDSLKQWDMAQGNVIKLVKSSLENDLRTDAISAMSNWVKSASEISGSKTEVKNRFDRFRLWLTDARYAALSKALQALINADITLGGAKLAQTPLAEIIAEFEADLDLGKAVSDQFSVEAIVGQLATGIRKHSLTFSYLLGEIQKNPAYKQYIQDCVSEGACQDIPEFATKVES